MCFCFDFSKLEKGCLKKVVLIQAPSFKFEAWCLDFLTRIILTAALATNKFLINCMVSFSKLTK